MYYARTYAHYVFLIVTAIIGAAYTTVNFYPDAPVLSVIEKASEKSVSTEQLNTIISDNPIQFKNTKVVPTPDNQQAVIMFKSVDQQMQARDFINSVYAKTLSASPNLQANYPSWLKFFGATPMKLGLDLRGGVHLTLNVDVESSTLASGQDNAQDLIKKIHNQELDYDRATKINNGVSLTFENADKAIAAANVINKQRFAKATAQGAKVDIIAEAQSMSDKQEYIMQRTLESIHKRVNELGLSEAVIQKQGSRHINIDLPGIQDMQRAKAIIGNTATLSFHIVSSYDPNNKNSADDILLNTKDGHALWLEKDAILNGDSITFAVATSDQGRPIIQIQLNGGSAEEGFYAATAENTGKSLAIVYHETINNAETKKKQVQKTILSFPRIKQPLRGSFIIEGMRSFEEAETLALLLRSGSLAAPIDIVHETTVGPSLGEDNIQKGVFSIAVGLGVVVVFMTVYYRLFGIIANLGLLYNLVLIVTCLSLLDATMSLPAMAAIVLTVGMAVDANVLINERIREELRSGTPTMSAIAYGYDKAFATILDANITTFIVSIVLYGLGSGMIKGFAITLIIGLICSMLSSVYATRIMTGAVQHRISNVNAAIGI